MARIENTECIHCGCSYDPAETEICPKCGRYANDENDIYTQDELDIMNNNK